MSINSGELHHPHLVGLWFSVFSTVETLSAQSVAAAIVVGSYFAVRRQTAKLQLEFEGV